MVKANNNKDIIEEPQAENTETNKKNDEISKENKKRKIKRKIEPNELIECRSVTNSLMLSYVSPRTGLEINWSNYGDVEYVEYSELLAMKSKQNRFLMEPWIIIEDEDVIEALGLRKYYDNIIDVDNVEDFFHLPPEEIRQKIMKAPNGTKEVIISKAREMIENEALFDLRKINVLNEVLNIDLTMVQK